MSSSFVAALEAEIASLEEELSKNITYRRLAEARRMLGLYAPAPTAPLTPRVQVQGPMYVRERPVILRAPPSRRQSLERIKALDAARMFLIDRTSEPTPTAVIYDHIVGLGIEIPGNDPRNNLSAMLSNSSLFESHGRTGWTLAEAHEAPKNPT